MSDGEPEGVECPRCRGAKVLDGDEGPAGEPRGCGLCSGAGVVSESRKCDECDGNGWVQDDSDGGTMTCPKCDGDGYL